LDLLLHQPDLFGGQGIGPEKQEAASDWAGPLSSDGAAM
jgi:hypothetical protein